MRIVRRREVSARQFAGLTLAALVLSLISSLLASANWIRSEAQHPQHPSVELSAKKTNGWREAWAAHGGTRLLVDPQGENRWVCPRITGRERQPMCRRFTSNLLGVCRKDSHFQLVLANSGTRSSSAFGQKRNSYRGTA